MGSADGGASGRQARVAALRERLLASGLDRVEIARRIVAGEQVTMLRAMRWAWDWSQHETARRFNEMPPVVEATVTGRVVGGWESWPTRYGHKPDLENLVRLARLYRCQVRDLAEWITHWDTTPAPSAAAEVASP